MPASHALPPEPKKVGIWIRVSTEDQAQGDSPEHHRARAEHYCAAKGWAVAEVYDLAGVSGKSVMEHAETKRMLADLKSGRISGLVFSKLARLTRNARELMDFSDYFREHDADLISLQESIDTSTPAGRLFYNMVASTAQWEREEIVDRVRASVAVRAKLGKPLGGKPSYGFMWDGRQIVHEPGEAPVRRLIYELFAEHKRLKAVVRILNERGLRTRNGSRWSDTTVGRLLRDPSSKGLYRSNYSRNLGKKWEVKPESEHVYTSVEPIVSEELWQRCKDLLDRRKAMRVKPGKTSDHIFTGLLQCACGGRMYVVRHSAKYFCYACRNRIPCADLEELFRERVRDFRVNPETLRRHATRLEDSLGEKRELAASLRKEIARLKQQSEHILKLFVSKKIDADRFGELDGPNAERKRQLEEELPKVEAQASLLQIDGLRERHLASEAGSLYERWPTLTTGQKKEIVEIVTRSIIVGNGEITIELVQFPSFQEG